MPSFDVVSEIDMQEITNAVDQANREVTTRYDFKDTGSTITLDQKAMSITLESSSNDRVGAFRQVFEEKLVKRKISLKSVEFGDIADAAGGRARLTASLKAGISSDGAKKINTHIKGMKLKGVQVPDPGRPGPSDGQEARRPPGPSSHPFGSWTSRSPPVRELPD